MRRGALLTAFTLSGAATLMYEIVWVKWLVYLFGVTYHAITTIVTVFMLGLAVGALLSGRLADRLRDPLRLYAGLEIVVAACGLSFPLVFNAVAGVYHRLHGEGEVSFDAHLLLRFALSTLVLLVPTVAMGATLPALTRHVVADRRRLGVDLGWLYGINTLGAAAGCALTGFWLTHTLGLTATNRLAVALNVLAALLALWAGRGGQAASAPQAVSPGPEPAPATLDPSGTPSDGGAGTRGWGLLFAFFLAGFTVVAYELLWTRILVLINPNAHTVAFTVILTLLLIATALGSAAYARTRVQRQDPRRVWGAVQLLAGAAAAAGPWLFVTLREATGDAWFAQWTPVVRLLDLSISQDQALIVLLAVGVPAFASGVAFPAGNRMYVGRLQVLGADVGAVYFASTVGGIAGGFVTGFYLMPALGVKGTLFAMAAVNVALGVGILGAALLPSRRRLLALAPAAVAAVGVWALGTRLPVWMWINIPGEFEVAFYRDGRSTTDAGLVIQRHVGATKDLYSTGELIGANFFAVWAPIALADSPRRVMLQAFDAGGMSAMAASMPRVESVRAVDISDGYPLIGAFFVDENRDILHNPRFQHICNDARNALLVTRTPLDVIFHGVALYASYLEMATFEYFTLVRSRLAPGGLYAHKLHPAHLSADAYRRIVATFIAVFPSAWLWQSEIDDIQILIGWRDSAPRPSWPALLSSWPARLGNGLQPGWDLRDFAAHLETDRDGLVALSAGADLIHDDVLLRVTEVLPVLAMPAPSQAEEVRSDEDRFRNSPEGSAFTEDDRRRKAREAAEIRRMLDEHAASMGAYFEDIPPEEEALVAARRKAAKIFGR